MTSCTYVIVTCATYSKGAAMQLHRTCARPNRPTRPLHSPKDKAMCSVSPKFSGYQYSRISEPGRMRSRTSMHTTTASGHDLEDFQECRSVVCMIDRVCCVMYRCNYELLISPYNLFHPPTNTLQPERLLRLWAQSQTVVCVGNRENPGNLTRKQIGTTRRAIVY